MRVFYGVQGTGNGHISRARAMNHHFSAVGIDVDYLFSGRERQDYFDMEEFGDWQDRQGLSFVSDHGKIKTIATARQNNLLQLFRDIKMLDLSNYDQVICDFEPITAWAAKRQKIPCITLGHQYAFQHQIPIEGDSWLSRAIIKHFAPGTQQLGLHWHHFNQPILPPIVHLDEQQPETSENTILVYLGFESPDEVVALLQRFPQQQFIYYGKFDQREQQDNVRLEPLSLDGFKRDLHQCNGVVCNAGFELASEALQLGKKILVKPLHGQMEQLSNALALEQLKLGHRMDHLSHAALGHWLDSSNESRYHYPDVAKAIVDWLLNPSRCSVEQLSAQLWGQSTIDEL